MSEPFIGEIRLFTYSFAPRDFANCDGQLLPIAGNASLFSLLGTEFGGDGRTDFALPDLRSRVPMHVGHGPGLSLREVGDEGGSETVALATNDLPPHHHALSSGNLPTTDAVGNRTGPNGHRLAVANDGESNYSSGAATGNMALGGDTGDTGAGYAHNNLPPFLVIRFCIALEGIYPSRP